MKPILKYFFIPFCCCLFAVSTFAQQTPQVDSLRKQLQRAGEDTVKVNILFRLFSEYRMGDREEAIGYVNAAMALSEKLNYHEGVAGAWYKTATLYFFSENYKKTKECCTKAIEVAQQHSLTSVYAKACNVMAAALSAEKNNQEALKYYSKSINILEKNGDNTTLALTLTNAGESYHMLGQYEKAKELQFRALAIQKQSGNKWGELYPLRGIAKVHLARGRMDSAFIYYDKILEYSKWTQHPRELSITYADMAKAYELNKDFKKAYEYQTLHIQAKDSFNNQENVRQMTEMQTRFDSERKDNEIKLLNKDKEKQTALNAKQQTIIWLVISGLVLVIVFAIFILNRWRLTQKQKKIIEDQKVEVDEKNKIIEHKNRDILDSIQYAKRIQSLFLPSEKFIERVLGSKNEKRG